MCLAMSKCYVKKTWQVNIEFWWSILKLNRHGLVSVSSTGRGWGWITHMVSDCNISQSAASVYLITMSIEGDHLSVVGEHHHMMRWHTWSDTIRTTPPNIPLTITDVANHLAVRVPGLGQVWGMVGHAAEANLCCLEAALPCSLPMQTTHYIIVKIDSCIAVVVIMQPSQWQVA